MRGTIITSTILVEMVFPILIGSHSIVLPICCTFISGLIGIIRNTNGIFEVHITCQGTKVVHDTVDSEVVAVHTITVIVFI